MRLLCSLLVAVSLSACGEGVLSLGDPDDLEARTALANGDDGCAGIPHGAGLTASAIDGGDTGAFVREITPTGFRSISAHVVPPDYQTSSKGEQPWIYYGLSDGSHDTEAGLSFQRGNAQLPHRWLPYLRRGSQFVYGDRTILPGTRVFMKAYYKAGAVYLQIDGEVVGSIAVQLSSSLHARRVVGIATPFRFDGHDLQSSGLQGVIFDETQMIHVDGSVHALHSVERQRGSVCWPGAVVDYRRVDAQDLISLY
jgi:hypothetical protein